MANFCNRECAQLFGNLEVFDLYSLLTGVQTSNRTPTSQQRS